VQVFTRGLASWYGLVGSFHATALMPDGVDDDAQMTTETFSFLMSIVFTTSLTSVGFFVIFLITQPKAFAFLKYRLFTGRRYKPPVIKRSAAAIDFNVNSSVGSSVVDNGIDYDVKVTSISNAVISTYVIDLCDEELMEVIDNGLENKSGEYSIGHGGSEILNPIGMRLDSHF
jgi:hypothetical protein